MKMNKLLLVGILSILLLMLAACGDNEEAANQDNNQLTSSAKTDTPSNENLNTQQVEHRGNNDADLDNNRFGVDLGDRARDRITRDDMFDQDFPSGDGKPMDQEADMIGDRNNDTGLNEFQTQQGFSEYTATVIKLTNQQRRNMGLPELKVHKQLSKVAQKKSMDMHNSDYFSHTSPTYGSPFDMMQEFGISYQSAGENIARGQQTPQQVVGAWMESPGHRANILNENFTHIGVGYVEDGHYWTQMFIEK